MIRSWAVILFYFLSIFSLQAQKIILLNSEKTGILGKYTSVLEDPAEEFNIHRVVTSKNKFSPITKDVFTSTKSESDFWIKFQAKNLSDKNYYLVIENPYINELDFYSEDQQGQITLLDKSGNSLPFSQRPIDKNHFIFPIPLSKGEIKTFYIRYSSTWRMEIPMTIQTSSAIIENSTKKDLWYGFYYGVYLVAMIYVFFLYIMIREKSFLYFLGLSISSGIFRSLNHGLSFQFIYPNHPLLNNFLIYIFATLLGFFIVRFSQVFLKTKERTPKLHTFANVNLILLFLTYFVSFFSKSWWAMSLNILAVIFTPYLILVGIKAYSQGFTPAKFYLVAAISYSINFWTAIIRNFGLLPYSFSVYNIADFLFLFTIVFFSLALGDRYNLLEEEKLKAQDKLTKELELKVKDRSTASEKQRELNESLEQSLALSRATLESTADGILVVDQQGKIKGFNQQFINMWQIPPAILESRDDERALEFVLDQLSNPKEFIAKVKELYSKQEEESFDELRFKDGKIFERFSKPQIAGNKIIGRVWSFRDVTEQKKTEVKNKQLNKNLEHKVNDLTVAHKELKKVNLELIQSNTDLDNFIYTASHDLRIPISNIEGLLNILQSKAYDENEYSKILGMIDVSVDQFKHTVGDLIELTKVQRMREDDIVDITIIKTVNEINAEFEEQIKKHKVALKTEVGENPVIRYSKRNFKRILDNLISNAIKFRSPDRQPEITITTESKGDFIILSVQDNGLGIAESNKKRVFELFKKAHDHMEGKGIGLYIIKRLIEKGGGRIELTSEEGKGSTFSIYFRKDLQLS